MKIAVIARMPSVPKTHLQTREGGIFLFRSAASRSFVGIRAFDKGGSGLATGGNLDQLIALRAIYSDARCSFLD